MLPKRLSHEHLRSARSRLVGSLTSGTVSHVPYGIAYDGKNALWSTSFYESKLYRINATTLEVEREISLANTDDSLCTDITIDRETSTLYVHKIGFSSAASAGGFIYTMDTNGVITNKFDSPATVYPVGLEFVDGNLLVGDRDGKRMLYTIDKVTGKKICGKQNVLSMILVRAASATTASKISIDRLRYKSVSA